MNARYRFRFTFIVLLPLLIACGRPASYALGEDPVAAASPASQEKLKAEILALINDYRNEKNLQPLRAVGFIETVAEKHSRNMASGRVRFGHDGFDDRYAETSKGIKGMQGMAENVAYGKLSAQRVVDLWLNSTGHRKNIEGKYTHTGIGIAVNDKGQLYFTQLFVLQ